MVALVGIISKKNQPIAGLLLKMLTRVNQKDQDKYSICLNDNVFNHNALSGFDFPTKAGNIGIGIACNDPKKIEDIKIDSQNVYLAFVGQVYLEKRSEPLSIEDIKLIVSKYFDSNNIKNSIKKIIDLLSDSFVFILKTKDRLIIARDEIGFKPIYLAENDEIIVCATEKKSIWELGLRSDLRAILPGECVVLSPEQIISYNFRDSIQNRIKKIGFKESLDRVEELLTESLTKRINTDEVAVLFSGGLDSTILAKLIKNLGYDVQLFTASFLNGKDFKNATSVAKEIGLPLINNELTDDKIRNELQNIIYHLEDWDSLKVEIGIPIYFASQLVSEHGFSSVFAGQGADELFAGYNRYERVWKTKNYQSLQDILYQDVFNLWHHDLERDYKLTLATGIDLNLPYLDLNFVKLCLTIPPDYKIRERHGRYHRKYILTEFGRRLGLKSDILTQPKVALQYGSGSTKSLKRIAGSINLNGQLAKDLGLKTSIDVLTRGIFQLIGFAEDNSELPDSVVKKIKSIL